MSKKKSNSFERFCSFSAMYDASYKVCRNVRWKDSVIKFEQNRLDIILQTERDLRNNEYLQLVFSCFSVIERGKQRDIRACHINDRLVQNALCEEALLPELTPKFIYDNCATLRDKGIDFALKRIRKHLQQAHREYGLDKPFYGARIDIRKYFDSIDHESLRRIAREVIKEDDVYELVSYLISTFSYALTKDTEPIPGKIYYVVKGKHYIKADNIRKFSPGRKYYEYKEKSLGLGSQTSQLLALLSLNEIDHFIKEELHIKYYGRYMDDLYLLHNDSQYLTYCLDRIEEKLIEVCLEMNRKKTSITKIEPVVNGVKKAPFKYLKWDFYLTDTNKIIQTPFKIKIAKERRTLRKMSNLWKAGKITTAAVQQHYQGWRAHVNTGTTFYVLQRMDNYFRSLFKGVEIL